jgi:hypothetical protein
MFHTSARVLAVVALAALLSSPATRAAVSDHHVDRSGRDEARRAAPKPLPLGSTYRGLTYGEWAARWWQESFATLEAQSDPFAIFKGAYGRNNDMVFLTGAVMPAGSPKVTIPVTVRHGTHLFVPIITVECSVAEAPPFHGEDEAELRTCANGLLNLVSDPYAEIDGRPVENPWAYRVESPLFRYGPLAEGNVLHLPPGTQSDAVAAGYFLLIPPLNVGLHRLSVSASVPDVGFAVDAEFIINVEPRRKR